MTRFLTWLVLASVACLAACMRVNREPVDSIRFAHGPHLLTGANCVTCHTGATLAQGEATSMFPQEEQCKACHASAEEGRCSFCHTAPTQPGGYRRLENDILFVHGPHVQRVFGGCIQCHGAGMSDHSVAQFNPSIPSMDACTTCHAADMQQLNCARCHTNLHNYSVEALSFIRHDPGFVRGHGSRARVEQTLCTQCHDAGFCTDCHDGTRTVPLEVLRPMRVIHDMVHSGSWLARHPTEARLERGSCLRCHGVSFCDDCHRETGVGGSVEQGDRHPVGWLNPLSADFHGREARRDITRCVACHESNAETTCIPCHRAGGAAPNPHPSGFGAGTDPLRQGMCRTCHAATP